MCTRLEGRIATLQLLDRVAEYRFVGVPLFVCVTFSTQDRRRGDADCPAGTLC